MKKKNPLRLLGLALVMSSAVLLAACSDSRSTKMSELTQVQMEEITKNLKGEEKALLDKFLGMKAMEEALLPLLGSKEEKANFKPRGSYSVNEAIQFVKDQKK